MLCICHVQVIVFFPTARAAQFHAALARASGCSCYDLHSRLSQKQRDTAAAAFGSNPTGVIFASDVIARGLDFPDVSLVVQVGTSVYCLIGGIWLCRWELQFLGCCFGLLPSWEGVGRLAI
jgi:superfamily II helicase